MTTIIEGKIWSYILECPSVIFLIVINLIPLIGVVAFGWNVGFLMLIYWMETVIIGLFNFGHVMFLNSLFDLPTVCFDIIIVVVGLSLSHVFSLIVNWFGKRKCGNIKMLLSMSRRSNPMAGSSSCMLLFWSATSFWSGAIRALWGR